MAGQRLTRDLQHSMLGGVCAGFANRYDFDVTLVRVVTVLLALATGGIGLPVYIAAWIIMPRDDSPPPAPRPASETPERLGDELREVSDRLAEAARVLADKTREAAEQISEIARRSRATAPSAETATPPHPSIEEIEESEAIPNGGEPDEDTPATLLAHAATAEQHPNPPVPPAPPPPPPVWPPR